MSSAKRRVVVAIPIIAALCAIAFKTTSIDPFVLLLVGVFVVLAIYALWSPPSKHKSFSYEDQKTAVKIDLGMIQRGFRLPIPSWAKGKGKQKWPKQP
jgi:membrane protein YdbS with pleckstrin-like domain